MTQAITLKNRIESLGHSVYGGVGINPRRKVPNFFQEAFGQELFSYQSPNFLVDQKGKGLQIGKSILHNLLRTQKFLGQINFLNRKIKEIQPEAIINFYEPLFGLHNYLKGNNLPSFSIAHQFLILHPDFEKYQGSVSDRLSLKYFTKLTGYGSRKLFGLSFYPIVDKGKIVSVPPLLRKEIRELPSSNEGFFLAYLLNPGYLDEIKNWSAKNPGIKIRCFTDSIMEESSQKFNDDLELFGLSGKNFLGSLAGCKGLVTTSGFESVCESMYLGKPVLMVPVKNHYEQFVNSRDGAKAKAGIYSDHFDLDRFQHFIENDYEGNMDFTSWVESQQNKMLDVIFDELKE